MTYRRFQKLRGVLSPFWLTAVCVQAGMIQHSLADPFRIRQTRLWLDMAFFGQAYYGYHELCHAFLIGRLRPTPTLTGPG